MISERQISDNGSKEIKGTKGTKGTIFCVFRESTNRFLTTSLHFGRYMCVNI